MNRLFLRGGIDRAERSRPNADSSLLHSSHPERSLLSMSRSLPKFCASVVFGIVLGAPSLVEAAYTGVVFGESSDGEIYEGDEPSTLTVVLFEAGSRTTVDASNCEVSGTLVVTGGSATEGSDFILSTHSFTIPVNTDDSNGEAVFQTTVQVSALADDEFEGDEDFVVYATEIQDGCQYYGGVYDGESETSASITIIDATDEPEDPTRDLAGAPGLTARQREIADVLDRACRVIEDSLMLEEQEARALAADASPEKQLELLEACDALAASSTLGDDLDSLAFRSVTSLGLMARQGALLRAQNLSRLIDRRRQGGGGLDLSGLQLRQDGQVLSGDLLTRGAGAGDQLDNGRWGAFLTGALEVGDFETNPAIQSYDFDVRVFLGGIDYRIDDRWVIGGAVGYTDSSVELGRNSGDTGMDGVSGALFASYYHDDKAYVDLSVSAGRSEYDTQRTLTIAGTTQRARGETDGSEYTATLNGGYFFRWTRHYIRLFGTLNYMNAEIDGFSETPAGGGGGGVLLELGDQRIESTTLGFGTELGWNFNTNFAVLSPQLTLDCEHRYGDDIRTSGGRFLGDPTATVFAIGTESPDRDYCHASAGLSAVFPGGMSSYTVYRASLLRDDLDTGELSLGIRGEF